MPQETKPFKLSPSSINLMEECPRCFWLTQHKIWKRPQAPFPSLPSGMDKILKAHFDKFINKKELPIELKENKECRGCKLFNNIELLNIWRNNRKGISLTDKQGNILHGAVDNILTKGKKLIVIDYKTRGFPLKEDTAEHYRNQLNIYDFLLKKNGYDTEDYSFLLFYIPKEVTATGEVIFDTILVKMRTNPENAEKLWKKALKLLRGPCPKASCEWCEGKG